MIDNFLLLLSFTMQQWDNKISFKGSRYYRSTSCVSSLDIWNRTRADPWHCHQWNENPNRHAVVSHTFCRKSLHRTADTYLVHLKLGAGVLTWYQFCVEWSLHVQLEVSLQDSETWCPSCKMLTPMHPAFLNLKGLQEYYRIFRCRVVFGVLSPQLKIHVHFLLTSHQHVYSTCSTEQLYSQH